MPNPKNQRRMNLGVRQNRNVRQDKSTTCSSSCRDLTLREPRTSSSETQNATHKLGTECPHFYTRFPASAEMLGILLRTKRSFDTATHAFNSLRTALEMQT